MEEKEVCEATEEKEAPAGEEVGKVTHYFTKIGVGAIKLTGTLKIGDRIRIEGKGATRPFEQTVESMEINNKPVQEAGPGDEIGLKVKERVRENDIVYKIEAKE